MAKRYSYISKKIDKETNNRIYSSTLYPRIDARNTDVVLVVKDGSNRLDLIAWKYYKSPTLWWVISQANNLKGDTMYVEVGSKIRIPTHIEDILRDMDLLNNKR
tara:strand:- start:287 stop:598 length:312 start_codon:yes stop_codon:yes gene_type:complete